MSLLKPRTLFGRTLATIALVSIGFQLFMIIVVASLMLIPLGKRSANDLAAVMISAADHWQKAGPQRDSLTAEYRQRYNITLGTEKRPSLVSDSLLPYRFFLEQALSRRIGTPVVLYENDDPDQAQWFWVDLPIRDEVVTIGFPRSRIGVHPPLAILLVLIVGVGVTLLTVSLLVKRLAAPLESLSTAVKTLGGGEWPEPIPESGPEELAQLARSFNRMTGQVRELLANRTTLLAGISHDLRTPITQIQLSLEMLPGEGGDAELMAGIRRDLARIDKLIGMFLEISRGLEGKQQESQLIQPMLDELVNQFRARGESVSLQVCHNCRLTINATAFTRILSNLLENAVRYGAGQPVSVHCQCAGREVEIIVEDNGPGIPVDEIENVFRPFYRLESSRNQATGGSGLGLAIVRQLAQAYGWQVELRPKPSVGLEAVLKVRC